MQHFDSFVLYMNLSNDMESKIHSFYFVQVLPDSVSIFYRRIVPSSVPFYVGFLVLFCLSFYFKALPVLSFPSPYSADLLMHINIFIYFLWKGCFPTLATIPVWIGLYQALSNVANEVIKRLLSHYLLGDFIELKLLCLHTSSSLLIFVNHSVWRDCWQKVSFGFPLWVAQLQLLPDKVDLACLGFFHLW